MSDNAFNNPFATLKKSNFPAGQAEAGSQPGSKPRQPAKTHNKKGVHPAPGKSNTVPTAPPAAQDEDVELFMDAVRFIKPLTHKQEGRKTKTPPPLHTVMSETTDMATVLASEPTQGKSPFVAGEPKLQPVTASPLQRASTAKSVMSAHSLEQDDDFVDFAAAMRFVAPLDGKGRAVPQEVPSPVAVAAPLPDDGNDLTFAVNTNGAYVEGHLLGLDLLLVGKLQAGQFKPEAHLDLHGLTAQQAFHTLVHFLRGAYTKDQRAVLIVSGQGRNSPAGVGVLREKIQDWLVQEPLRRVVLAFCSADPAHGGTGALYVLLRRFRKDRRPIYWERHPADPDLIWGTEQS